MVAVAWSRQGRGLRCSASLAALVVAVTAAAGCTPTGDAAETSRPGIPSPRDGGSPRPLTPLLAPEAGASARPLTGKVIVLDPGHNGGNAAHPEIIGRLVDAVTLRKPCDTVGTQTASGYAETAFNFDVATRLAALLQARGARVTLTRRDDRGVGPCITERAAIGNAAHADAALSIHADGGPPDGVGFHVILPALVRGHTEPIVTPSRRLGETIRASYRAGTGEPYATYTGHDGLLVRDDLAGLNRSTVPKVFIECGNMRNRADAARLTDPAFRQRVAAALADGFTRFLTGR